MADVLLEGIAHLSQDEDLLVSHQLLLVGIQHARLDGVLYLALWLLPDVLINELEARWEIRGHDEGEGDGVVTRDKLVHGENVGRRLESEDILLVTALHLERLLAAINLTSLSVLEAYLFDSFHVDHDLLGLTVAGASDGDAPGDHRARVVELAVGLHDEIAALIFTPRVDVSHILIFM